MHLPYHIHRSYMYDLALRFDMRKTSTGLLQSPEDKMEVLYSSLYLEVLWAPEPEKQTLYEKQQT